MGAAAVGAKEGGDGRGGSRSFVPSSLSLFVCVFLFCFPLSFTFSQFHGGLGFLGKGNKKRVLGPGGNILI